ncbi:outer membrane protein assembly factor BamD [Aquamicrobium zhengzhouense]|uniref:Outer membrane protein assembly factor BamD n=1 Tax=Aquamicrobium zhengzhouense TaxID=2781738 RepID=A0ABS0S755_9HYPH|nr:outer membrane protein assembly factor BamD [Aquamicrobium zhengzhouense]MBI1619122.1 outer membrane protein assembly factor BamD [Aquamicrobium zhengzhouense]
MSEYNTAETGSPRRSLALAVAAAVLPLMVTACASDKNVDLASYVETVEPAETLYNQALANLDAGRMAEASRKFEAVDRQHPYSEPARKSLLMSAFTNYRSGKYEEAITAGQRYVSLYPTSDDAAYAQYLIGLSHFRQIRDVTQDQKEARRTAEAMRELVERWPDSEYVEDAHAKIRYARDQLAGKEMQIGRYYLERREYVGSIKRFRNVVEMYSDTRHIEEALARLTETYLAMGLASEAQAAAAVLGHNYPDSQWYKDTYKLLQSGGLEPRESRGSWLSGVGKLLGASES